MPSESDRLLVQQIRQGDPRAWEHLISRYEGRLLAFIERRLRDRAASEDVVQETFVGFLNSLPNFDDRRELQTYLFTIASHKLTDHLRSEEHTSELQSRFDLVCRLLLEKKKNDRNTHLILIHMQYQ